MRPRHHCSHNLFRCQYEDDDEEIQCSFFRIELANRIEGGQSVGNRYLLREASAPGAWHTFDTFNTMQEARDTLAKLVRRKKGQP